MNFNKEIFEAVIRNKQLKKIILEDSVLTEENLSDDKFFVRNNTEIEGMVMSSMLKEYLDYTLEYPHPINTSAQVMNPIKILGVRGAYMVIEDYQEINFKYSFFSSKVEANKFAKLAYEEFLIKTNLKSRSKGLKPYLN